MAKIVIACILPFLASVSPLLTASSEDDTFLGALGLLSRLLHKVPPREVWHLFSHEVPSIDRLLRHMEETFDATILLPRSVAALHFGGIVLVLTSDMAFFDKTFEDYHGRVFVFSNDLFALKTDPLAYYQLNHTHLNILLNSSSFYFINRETNTYQLSSADSVNPNVTFGNDGNVIIARTFNCTFFSYFKDYDESGHPDEFDGLEYTIFKVAVEKLKWKWRVKPSKGFGWMWSNWTYKDGLHHDIWSGDGDIGFCSQWLLAESLPHLEVAFSDSHCLKFLVPRPQPVSFPWTALVTSFSLQFWLFTFISAALTCISHYVSSRAVNFLHISGEPEKMTDAVFRILSILAQNNFPDPKKVIGSFRPLMISWIFLSFLVGVIYTSHLVGLLTSTTLSPTLNTLEDVVKEKCSWSINGYVENDEIFKDSQEPIHAELWKYRVHFPPGPRTDISNLECFAEIGENVGNIFFVALGYKEGLYDNHQASRECLLANRMGFTFRKNSKYAEPFQQMLLQMTDTGIVRKIEEDVINSKKFDKYIIGKAYVFTSAFSSSTAKPINIRQLQGIFFILFIGHGASLIVLIMETIVKYMSIEDEHLEVVKYNNSYYYFLTYAQISI